MKIGFDNDKYLAMQSEHIRERIQKFDNKLYLEFGGKLFDDYHASRVLPGFQPDSKLQMLLQLKDQAEIVIVISAEDIVSSKIRGDYGITYDLDVLRLIDAFQGVGLYVGSVCVTKYTAAPEVEAFEKRLNDLGIRTDVLDCCPKDQGMMMLVRSMAPQVVAVDEIGSAGDVEAVGYIQSCGCALVATVHGASLEDIYSKPALGQLVEEGVFERYILLEPFPENGRNLRILDRDGRELAGPPGRLRPDTPPPQTVSHPNERLGERICC